MRRGIWAVIALLLTSGLASADDIPASVLDNPIERILICTPQGPLIVQVSFAFEGRPYRHAAEDVVDEHFDLIASGNRSWDAAFDNARLLAGRLRRFSIPRTRALFIAKHDRDGDRMISRSELRSALLDAAGGDTLRIVHDRSSSNSTDQLFALVDANGDWRLSAEELQQAPARLARADFTGDEAVTLAELERADPRRKSPFATLAVVLSREESASVAAQELRTHYANAEGAILPSAFAIAPALFDRLDADRDGALQDSELPRIAQLPAQITLAVDYTEGSERPPQWCQLKGTSPDLQVDTYESRPTTALHHWSKGESGLSVSGVIPSQRDAVGTAAALIKRYDSNKNGYLEREEAMRVDPTGALGLHGDGLIFRHNIVAALVRQQFVGGCWIEIDVNRQPPRLWPQLDTNSDQSLGARELRKLAELIARYDADGDGEVAYTEIPYQLEVRIRRGSQTTARAVAEDRRPRPIQRSGPIWFQAMDRNRDGDVSEREFLGTLDQFQRTDADHDGLIDPREAQAATP